MEALVACLAQSLESDQRARHAAERELEQRAYPRNDPAGAFGVELAQVFASDAVALPLRQAAGIALKKYVYERWSLYFDEFLRTATRASEPPTDTGAVPFEAKHQVHLLLLQALGDAQRKVRLLASQLLSIVGSCDFPDQFTELLPELQVYLRAYTAQDPRAADKVHGAMKFLSDFVQVELDENQLLVVAQEFVPLLQEILSESDGVLSAHTKARCMLVFRQCLTSLYTVRDAYAAMVKEAVDHYLAPWLQAMRTMLDPSALASADWRRASSWEVLGLRREIVRTLGTAARFRKQFAPHAAPILAVCLANLRQLLPLFTQSELVQEPVYDEPAEIEGDTDVAANASRLAVATMAFFSEILEQPWMRDLLLSGGAGGDGEATPALGELMHLLILYAQITREDEETFDEDPAAFVDEDDEDSMLVTLRTSSADLLDQLLDVYPLPTLRTLPGVVDGVSSEADATRASNPLWWKPVESTLMLLGNTHSLVDEILAGAEDATSFRPAHVVHQLAVPNLDERAPSFLRGRSFVFVSQYVGDLDETFGRRVFTEAMRVIHAADAHTPLHVQLSAVRALRNFGQQTDSMQADDARAVLEQLGPLLLRAAGSPLVLVVDAVEAALPRARFTQQDAPILLAVARAAVGAWRANATDPNVEISLSALLESLVGLASAETAAAMVRMVLEASASALTEEGSDTLGASAAALARSLLQAAPAPALQGAWAPFFGPAAHYLLHAQDAEGCQNLVFCLTLFWQKCPEEVLAWRDAQGTAALEILLRIVQSLLQKEDEALCGMSLGMLLLVLFLQAQTHTAAMAGLGTVMPGLVHALAAKLAVAKTTDCTMSLLLPLTYLFAEHTESVIRLLSSVTVAAPEDAPALPVVVAQWVDHADLAMGRSAVNMQLLALTQLLMHWPPALDALTVRGEVRAVPGHGTSAC